MKAKELGKQIALSFCNAKLEGKSDQYLEKLNEILIKVCFTELRDKLKARKVSTDQGLANCIREQRVRWKAIVKTANGLQHEVVTVKMFDDVIKDQWPEFSYWYDKLVVDV